MFDKLSRLITSKSDAGLDKLSHIVTSYEDTRKKTRESQFNMVEGEEIIKSGRVQLVYRGNGIESDLCLTNKRLRFESKQGIDLFYPLTEITAVALSSSWLMFSFGLQITFKDGRKTYFSTFKREVWAQAIIEAVALADSTYYVKLTEEDKPTAVNLHAIQYNLNQSFSIDELKTLCFDLDIDYANLSGTTKEDKIDALLAYCRQQNTFDHLLEYGQSQRPHLNWFGRPPD